LTFAGGGTRPPPGTCRTLALHGRRPRADRGAMTRRIVLATLAVFAVLAPAASALPYAPPAGKVALGVAGRAETGAFVAAHGRQPSVFQTFVMFRGPIDYAFERADNLGAAPMLHISTADGPDAREVVTPKGIALGEVDRWLVDLQARAAAADGPVYLRVMGEMNGHWNQYSAYGPAGRRNDAHSTRWFKQAWRRIAIIMRGGPRIDAKLRYNKLPPLGRGDLPTARVALVWCPQVAGAPDVPGNAPKAYWPGAKWVDWVATDFYSKFPNFTGLERFYQQFGGKPFAFGEWAIWDSDNPGFATRFFAWVRSHKRVKMLIYNQGHIRGGPFDLGRFPASTRAIRAATRSSRYDG
jgi:hypothetical protein